MKVVAVGDRFEHISLESVEMRVNTRGVYDIYAFAGTAQKILANFLGVINGLEGSEHSRDSQYGLCV